MARPTRTMMIAAAAVVAAATVGGGVTYLATSHTAQATTAQAAPMEGHGRAGRAGRGGHGGAGGAGMLGKIEHGEFTTASAGVMQVQRGAITAIDSGSVTVRSADGFTASYAITPTTAVGRAGRGHRAQAPAAAPGAAPGAPGAAPGATADVSQLQTGDTVQVMATKTDTGSTATRIAPTRA